MILGSYRSALWFNKRKDENILVFSWASIPFDPVLRYVPFLDMLPSSMLAPAEESSRSFDTSSSVSSSSPLWLRRFQ